MPTWELHQRDALAHLASMDTGSVDAVITDPPYSSGGMMRGDRTGNTRVKYTGSKTELPSALDFAGDNRDGHGWAYWMTLWLSEALRVTTVGGALVMFTDWRQLPTATDSIQAGGWVWRGVVPWIKPDARPQRGRFTQSAEFVVWGTAGPRGLVGDTLPGYYHARVPRNNDPGGRHHITEKPLDVMRSLVRICPDGGTVLDPFAGAGTTGRAALLEGRRFIGCEITEHYAEVSRQRIAEAAEPLDHMST
ncbi:site-specific DNA-methyltransferase (adenine-specific) [Actinopolyspora xinjiangensis]|uniref:Methyltransferase n=1 Tax=Actinopolyspora xinjiangensis TaxID=405564 RepID=A0A1H0U4Q7_9ACTN|nr:site-specific DNA-methyltransferase (adenine-specific) [Actinopolyspora xinjiangensis]